MKAAGVERSVRPVKITARIIEVAILELAIDEYRIVDDKCPASKPLISQGFHRIEDLRWFMASPSWIRAKDMEGHACTYRSHGTTFLFACASYFVILRLRKYLGP